MLPQGPFYFTYRWLSTKLQYLQCVSNRDTAAVLWTIIMLAGFSSCESFYSSVFEVFLQSYLCYITYAIQDVIVMHPDCLMAICTPGCYMKYCCLHLWHVTMETSNKSSPMPVFWTQFCEQLGQCNYSYIALVNAYGNISWYTINIFQLSFSSIFDIHGSFYDEQLLINILKN